MKKISIDMGENILYSVDVRSGPPNKNKFTNFFNTFPNKEYDDEFDKLPAGFDCAAYDGNGKKVVDEFIENKE